MPSMNCPDCDGTGYTHQEVSEETVICARCNGTGTLFVDEAVDAVEGEHWA
jgi:DnaJ-class molecular chaperone